MKNNYLNKIFIILLLFISSYPIFSQTNASADLIKYWFYRDRLNKYFVVPGEKIGESQVVCVRNAIDGDDPDSTNIGKHQNIDYGQHGTYQGLYIGVLATEYYLLSENGQTADAANTYNELYEALYAVKAYMDSLAKPYWSKPGLFDGFFVRETVPCDFLNPTAPDGITINGKKHLDLLNKHLTSADSWNPSTNTFGSFQQGHPGYADYRTNSWCLTNYSVPVDNDSPQHPESMSQDDAVRILIGLSLAVKLTPNASTCQTLAKVMSDNILTHALNLDLEYNSEPYVIYEPDGSVVGQTPTWNPIKYLHNLTSAGGVTWPLGPGLFSAGYQITGNSIYTHFPSIWESHHTPFAVYMKLLDEAAQQIVFHFPSGQESGGLKATLLALGDYTSERIYMSTRNKDWDTFYILLWEVINGKKRSHHNQVKLLNRSINQLEFAPCEGPYCYSKFIYSGKGEKERRSLCRLGLGNDYRWFKDLNAQDGG